MDQSNRSLQVFLNITVTGGRATAEQFLDNVAWKSRDVEEKRN